MTNEELLSEYEFTVAIYIASADETTNATAEIYLKELKAEILKRMNK